MLGHARASSPGGLLNLVHQEHACLGAMREIRQAPQKSAKEMAPGLHWFGRAEARLTATRSHEYCCYLVVLRNGPLARRAPQLSVRALAHRARHAAVRARRASARARERAHEPGRLRVPGIA